MRRFTDAYTSFNRSSHGWATWQVIDVIDRVLSTMQRRATQPVKVIDIVAWCFYVRRISQHNSVIRIGTHYYISLLIYLLTYLLYACSRALMTSRQHRAAVSMGRVHGLVAWIDARQHGLHWWTVSQKALSCNVFTARRNASAVYAVIECLSVHRSVFQHKPARYENG